VGGVDFKSNAMSHEKQKYEWVEAHGIPREVPPHEPPIDWFIYWQEEESQEEECAVPTNINDEGEF